MKLWTYAEIESKIRKDLDLQDDDNFVGNDELAGYVNEGIDIAEAEIMKLNEDYFLRSVPLTFVLGTANYDLPADIYGQKIRSFIYANGPRIYEIERIRDPRKFLEKAIVDYNPTGEPFYGYMLKSVTAGEQDKIVIAPPAQESGTYGELWYIRNANRIPMSTDSGQSRTTQLATVLDVPEWYLFIIEFAKMRCREKEPTPLLETSRQNVEKMKQGLIDALTDRVPDNDTTVPPDTSFYWEHT